MNDASRNTVKGNSPLNIDSFEVTQSILLLGVAATFEKSSSTVTAENRWLSWNQPPNTNIVGLAIWDILWDELTVPA